MNTSQEISKEMVTQYQEKWANAVVAVGRAFSDNQDYVALATQLVDELYAYDISEVLFKPTKAAEEQFRDSKSKAISYFVASNDTCAEDKGFALQPWTNVRFDNHKISLLGHSALAMGNYYFTDTSGAETKVEYSFGYICDQNGSLKISLHHSSLPYNA